MDPVSTGLLLVILALIAVAVLLRRSRRQLEERLGKPEAPGPAVAPVEDLDVVHPRPRVAALHVVDEEARVTFDVPLPAEEDEVLTELLVSEAIEVVREKQHTLPMAQVSRVVVLAGKGTPRRVGEARLEVPGELPPRLSAPPLLSLATIAADPLEHQFEDHVERVPTTQAPSAGDVLHPLGGELQLPKAVETGLRAQGIDPATMSAGDLVAGTLRLLGYRVAPGSAPDTFLASKGGTATFIRQDGYETGDYPEVEGEAIRRFVLEFEQSGADRGLYVSEKYAPFEIYERERREPRIRFVTRERLQKMVDALALS